MKIPRNIARSGSWLRPLGIKRGLSWSGVYESARSPKHPALRTVWSAQSLSKQPAFETTIYGPEFWKNLRFGLSPTFFYTSLRLQLRKRGFKFADALITRPRRLQHRANWLVFRRNKTRLLSGRAKKTHQRTSSLQGVLPGSWTRFGSYLAARRPRSIETRKEYSRLPNQ